MLILNNMDCYTQTTYNPIKFFNKHFIKGTIALNY